MTPGVGSNIGIDTSGFDYIEGSGFVMEGLEDKGLDAKSYIQSVLRRHEGVYFKLMKLFQPGHYYFLRLKLLLSKKATLNLRWSNYNRWGHS